MKPWWAENYHDGLAFTWDLLYTCNYRCSYCWWDPHWADLERNFPQHPTEKWIECWGRVHERYGRVKIDILGGEPFLYPKFNELVRAMARWHRLLITSNLSPELSRIEEVLSFVTPDNFHVNASYHPQFAAPGPFLKKLAVLRDRGFEPGVLVVSHPSFLQDLPALRKAFRAEGHPFTTLVFRGEYNGKPYPESFTPEEKAVVSETIAQEGAQRASYKRFQLDRDDTLGRLCYTGSVYGNVKPTGEVYRCGRDQTALKPIGNIFDPDFRMDPAPTACPFKNCSCQEYIYVAEEYEPWLAARGEKRVVA